LHVVRGGVHVRDGTLAADPASVSHFTDSLSPGSTRFTRRRSPRMIA
jgi:hypothetical protein